MVEKASNFFWRVTVFQFPYRRYTETRDALLTLSHHFQVALEMGMKERLLQLNFSAAFDRVSHRSFLYKLRGIGARGQFWSIVSELLSDRRQRVL